MKCKENLLKQLKELPYFNNGMVYQLGKQLGLKDSTIKTYISRFLKRKELIQLKRGFYVSLEFYNKNKKDVSYLFYLANVIRTPSYISSWSALQYYNLTTDVIHTITSVTPKITRDYKNKIGNFSYNSIKKDFFTDFSLVKGRFDFFIASPSKALFDLLYFRTNQFRGVSIKEIKNLIRDLRIDINEMDKDEKIKFFNMIKKI